MLFSIVIFFPQSCTCVSEIEDFSLGQDYYVELKHLAENQYGTCWSDTIKKLKNMQGIKSNETKKTGFPAGQLFLR